MTIQHNGPYLVRVERACHCKHGSECAHAGVVSLEAVVDLEAATRIVEAWLPTDEILANLMHILSGGSYGPLPGGERITVEPTTDMVLLAELAADDPDLSVPAEVLRGRAELCAAWNEGCGVKRRGDANAPS